MAKYAPALFNARETLAEMAESLEKEGRLADFGGLILDRDAFESFVAQYDLGRPYPGWEELSREERFAKDILGWSSASVDFASRYEQNYVNGYVYGFVESLIYAKRLLAADATDRNGQTEDADEHTASSFESGERLDDAEIEAYLDGLSEEGRTRLVKKAKATFDKEEHRLDLPWERHCSAWLD